MTVEVKQARFAGEEMRSDAVPELAGPQENATIHPQPGELGYAPNVRRNEVAKNLAIIYGQATLSDAVNIFARALDEDLSILKKIGETGTHKIPLNFMGSPVWLQGLQTVVFSQAGLRS